MAKSIPGKVPANTTGRLSIKPAMAKGSPKPTSMRPPSK